VVSVSSKSIIPLYKQRAKKSIRHYSITKIWWHHDNIRCTSCWRIKQFLQVALTLEEQSYVSTIPSEMLSNINLSEELIFSKLLLLNGNKAPGPDALHPHFLKSCAALTNMALWNINHASQTYYNAITNGLQHLILVMVLLSSIWTILKLLTQSYIYVWWVNYNYMVLRVVFWSGFRAFWSEGNNV